MLNRPEPDPMTRFNPLHGNPLRTREDMAKATRDLIAPCLPYLKDRPGRLAIGSTASGWELETSELEGFSRLFWGLVPFLAGGFRYPEAEAALREGLIAGTDPAHSSYWGRAGGLVHGHKDQRLCEMAPIGLALAMAPEYFWEPLDAGQRQHVADWLLDCMDRPYNDNNWLFFRVIVSLGLERVGWSYPREAVETHLKRLESFYIEDGWYEDGGTGRYDHYIAFAMHFYGLVYARLAGARDADRAARMRERAGLFAPHYAAWFAQGGAGLPYGRSLTYRFAHASFWGAFALADCPGLDWGVVRGLILRNLRYWSTLPIARTDGVLSLGYGYANTAGIEEYSAEGSPFWALKSMIALAVPPDHPLWTSAEAEHPFGDGHSTFQPDPKFILHRHEGEVVALAGGQSAVPSGAGLPTFRNAAAKYAKFAYSTAHAFSVELDARHPSHGGFDNVLALRAAGDSHWRVREGNVAFRRLEGAMVATWMPWPDVVVETWLVDAHPWHIRVHSISTPRPLQTLEGGFAVDRTGDSWFANKDRSSITGVDAIALFPAGGAAIRDLIGNRAPEVIYGSANTNLLAPRTAIPSLVGTVHAGTTLLAAGCTFSRSEDGLLALCATGPKVPVWVDAILAAVQGNQE